MHTETKHTAIPVAVKEAVALRDRSGRYQFPSTCIICGAPGDPHCHVVRRSQGGRGDTERNIVTLCGPCHYAFDEGYGMKRLKKIGFDTQQDVKEYIYQYMKDHYPGWMPESVKYHKWEE